MSSTLRFTDLNEAWRPSDFDSSGATDDGPLIVRRARRRSPHVTPSYITRTLNDDDGVVDDTESSSAALLQRLLTRLDSASSASSLSTTTPQWLKQLFASSSKGSGWIPMTACVLFLIVALIVYLSHLRNRVDLLERLLYAHM